MTIESPPEADDVPTEPDGLSPEAQTLWADVLADLDEDGMELDAREVAILREVCRHLTLANRLESALADGPVVVAGSRGQDRVSPLVGEIDKVRRTVATLLRSLQPPDRSAINRANVARRWH